MTPDEPGTPPPTGSPPPPTYPGAPGTSARPAGARKRRRPLLWLFIVLIIGILLGLGGGYLLFNNKNVKITTSVTPTPSATATAVATATSAATLPPVQTPAPVAQGVVPCPVATPLGQHPLGSPGNPGQGQKQDATLDFCGAGNATIPTGTTRFMTPGNWGLGIADSCPVGSSGEGGMGTVLTVNELLLGGTQGPDNATEGGDWADSGSVLMPTGGNYRLRVTTVSPSCVWRINIYPSF